MSPEMQIQQALKKAVHDGKNISCIVMSNVFAALFLKEKGVLANGGTMDYQNQGNFDGQNLFFKLRIVIVDTTSFDFHLGYMEIGYERQQSWKKYETPPALPSLTSTLDWPLT